MTRRRRRGSEGSGALACDAIRLAISAGLDGEPSRPGTGASAAHLATCADCRQFEVGARALQRQVSLRASRKAPEALKDLLTRELAHTVTPPPLPSGRAGRPLPHRRWRRTAQWAGALIPVAALIVVLPLGPLSGATGKPTHASTPCTVNLRSHRVRVK
jgi:predicted anti-sigma-YlaC factor YlaD